MKQRVLERARRTVEAILRNRGADMRLEVLKVPSSPAGVRRDFAIQALLKVDADA